VFLQDHREQQPASRETDRFFTDSGVQIEQSTSGLFHFLRAAFSSDLKAKVGSTLGKAVALRVNTHHTRKHLVH
jgi:hypothetical protein